MRHGTSSSRRQRGNRGGGQRRGNGGGGNGSRMQVYDSNGPDVRIRGTAHQVAEKYEALAKDAMSSGDRVLAESYLQHAEHYQRIINSFNRDVQTVRTGEDRPPQDSQQRNQGRGDDLSLPASILGGLPEAKNETADKERTTEFTEG